MAELLAHPDKDRDFTSYLIPLRRGSISIKTYNSEHLTDELAVLILEQARQIIIDQSLE